MNSIESKRRGYSRVIPRDCFNEAKVLSGHLKMVNDYNNGKFPAGFYLAVDNESLDIEQSLDGDLALDGVVATFDEDNLTIGVVYNAGKTRRFPITVSAEDLDIYSVSVYNDQGDFDEEFIEAFGDSQAEPGQQIELSGRWEKARSFLIQLGRVGLWQVDCELSEDFIMDLNEPDLGFDLAFHAGGKVTSNNLIASIDGKPIYFHLGSSGELRFECHGLEGHVLTDNQEISPAFYSLAGPRLRDSGYAPPPPKM